MYWQKVEIYIDGKGNSIPVEDEPGTDTMLVFSIIFLMVFRIVNADYRTVKDVSYIGRYYQNKNMNRIFIIFKF